jgi:hypothetical protein
MADKKTNISPYTILMNWMKDGNLKSSYPKELENSTAISPVYFLSYFLAHPTYFIYINDYFNRYDLFYLDIKDLMKTMKEIIHYTRYSYFSKKKVPPKENVLVGILQKRFPYYKKEEIIMLVDFIDNSDEKDTVYEMFGLTTTKAKKLTKKEVKERQNKIDNIVSKNDILNLI